MIREGRLQQLAGDTLEKKAKVVEIQARAAALAARRGIDPAAGGRLAAPLEEKERRLQALQAVKEKLISQGKDVHAYDKALHDRSANADGPAAGPVGPQKDQKDKKRKKDKKDRKGKDKDKKKKKHKGDKKGKVDKPAKKKRKGSADSSSSSTSSSRRKEPPKETYTGRFQHPAFGPKPLEMSVCLRSNGEGSYTIMGKTIDSKVTLVKEGKRVIFSDGTIVFDGKLGKNGTVKGDVTMQGKTDGKFVLTPERAHVEQLDAGGSPSPRSPSPWLAAPVDPGEGDRIEAGTESPSPAPSVGRRSLSPELAQAVSGNEASSDTSGDEEAALSAAAAVSVAKASRAPPRRPLPGAKRRRILVALALAGTRPTAAKSAPQPPKVAAIAANRCIVGSLRSPPPGAPAGAARDSESESL